jgi:UrcA family protein
MNHFLAVSCTLLLASLNVSSAVAAATVEGGSRLVRYDDLDLSSALGISALNRRIDHALNQLCLDPSGPSPAPTVDIGCKQDGRRAASAQIAIAVAEQDVARPHPHAQLSIRLEKPLPLER